MKFRIALMASTVLLAPVAARAQQVYGPYVSVGGGVAFEQGEKTFVPGIDGAHNSLFHPGWTALGAVGYGLGDGWRVEAEGNYISNQFRHLSNAITSSTGGREDKYGAFVNGLYDFDLGYGYVYPYLGGGIGYQWSHLEPFKIGVGPDTYDAGGAKGNVAGQAIAGLSFPMPNMPGLTFTAEYRYQNIWGHRSYATSYDDAPISSISMGSVQNHSILLGVRYAFNTPTVAATATATTTAPPPAPAPVATPAPAPARTYLVFFDWDRADLTDKARQVISDAAQGIGKTQTTMIEVNGYTDLSGTAAYNQRLSVRRAKAVQAELVRLGVPGDEISIHGYGESNPLVPTAPGVREPQNRRVEIILK